MGEGVDGTDINLPECQEVFQQKAATFAYSDFVCGRKQNDCDLDGEEADRGWQEVRPDESFQVAVTIRNTGEVAGTDPSQLAFLDRDMKWKIEAGAVQVMIGASSQDIRYTGEIKITDDMHIDGRKRRFYADVRLR